MLSSCFAARADDWCMENNRPTEKKKRNNVSLHVKFKVYVDEAPERLV